MVGNAVSGDINGILARLEDLAHVLDRAPSGYAWSPQDCHTLLEKVRDQVRDIRTQAAAVKERGLRREERLEEMTAVLMSMAALNFSNRIELSREDESMDTLAAGLNMLAEELEATTISRQYLDNVLQAMPDMLIVVGPDGVIRTANKTAVSHLGYPPDAMVGMSAGHIIFTGNDPDHLQPLAGLPAKPERQVWYRKSDGHIFPGTFLCAPLNDESGEKGAFIVNARDITEQKKVLDALEESEERFRSMVDNAMDGILVADLETKRFHATNRAMVRMSGYSKDEILTLTVSDIHLPEHLPYVAEQFRLQAEGVKQLAENIPVRRKDGSVFIADVNSTRITLQGKPYLLGIFRDMTDRRRAAEVLESSENRFRALFNNISSGVAVYDVEDQGARFIFRDVNRAAERIDRVERDAVIGRNVADVFPGVEDMGLLEVFRRVWRSGEPEHFPAVLYVDDRLTGWRENYIYKLPSGEIVAVYDDVTDKKRAEKELVRIADEWQTTFDSASDLISIQDTDFTLKRVNKAYAALFKKSPEELEGKKCYQVIHGLDHRPERCQCGTTIKEKRHCTWETFESSMGVYLEITTSPILDDEGNVTGLVHFAKDISERRKSEEVLKNTMDKLERSNRELTDFAHIASHDLKEPLRKIVTFGERVRAKAANLDERSRDYLARMQHAAGRMTGLLDGLLEYARITTKVRPFERVDLRRTVAEVLSDLEVRVQETGATVDIGDLPVVSADPLQMRQLFQNLIGNALKYRRPGVAPVITVASSCGTDADGPFYEITVTDNGIGITEEHYDRIFGVFQRLHGSGTYEGMGVGLSICKKIVDLHGGHISLESVVDKGSVFKIVLPRTIGADVDGSGCKLNCWEFKQCGRESGCAGNGACPATLNIPGMTGTNSGNRGGRYCWRIAGTLCQGHVQGTYAKKIDSCRNCEFYLRVKEEEGEAFRE